MKGQSSYLCVVQNVCLLLVLACGSDAPVEKSRSAQEDKVEKQEPLADGNQHIKSKTPVVTSTLPPEKPVHTPVQEKKTVSGLSQKQIFDYLQTITKLKAYQQTIAMVLDEFTMRTPEKLQLTKVEISGKAISISGVAERLVDVSKFTSLIEESDVMKEVYIYSVEPNTKDGKNERPFSLRATMVPNQTDFGLKAKNASSDDETLLFQHLLDTPKQASLSTLIKKISEDARKAGLEIARFEPQAEVLPEKGLFAIAPISIEMRGGFHDVATFVSTLSTYSGIVSPNELRIVGAEQDKEQALVTITMELAIHRLVQNISSSPTPRLQAEFFTYRPEQKRDPFHSFVARALQESSNDKTPKTPLQKFDLNQYQPTCVMNVADQSQQYVLLSIPLRNSIIAKSGDYIGKNWGKISKIGDDAIVVTEEYNNGKQIITRDFQFDIYGNREFTPFQATTDANVLTVNCNNADIHGVLRTLALLTEENIIVHEGISQKVSLKLVNVSKESIVRVMAVKHDLQMHPLTKDILSFLPKGFVASKAPKEKKYSGVNISINVEKMRMGSIMRVISHVSKMTVLPDKEASEVTLKVTDVPWGQVLDAIAYSYGLQVTQIDNTMVLKAVAGAGEKK